MRSDFSSNTEKYCLMCCSYLEQARSTRIAVAYPRQLALSAIKRTNHAPISLIMPKFLKVMQKKGKLKIVVPRSMTVEALS